MEALPYSDLAPTADCDPKSVYCDALMWALKNKRIHNVALAGPYGSGKSSVLKKFREQYGEERCIDISLASLTVSDTQDDKNEAVQRELIEMSILQQIFYCERSCNIPDSRFKRIKSITINNLRWMSAGVALWLLIGQLPFWLPEIHPHRQLWAFLVWMAVLGTGIFFGLTKLFRAMNGSRVSKLNVQQGEIELSKETDPSILNKYLDELLYFFEVTDYKVVIIEDLDRFNNPDIFIKLREINLLLNNAKQIDGDIAFIYALRDDIFQDKNRTKFFDFIIPVIPVINPTNAGDVLHTLLHDAGLSPYLINDISLYIDDMRLLKNICNEYHIYRKILGRELDPNKLFAMMVYKNLCPEDFAALHHRQGIVARVFDQKRRWMQPFYEKIDRKINDLRSELHALISLRFTELKELRAIYLEELRERLPDEAKGLKIDNREVSFSQLKEEGFPDELVNASQISYYRINSTIPATSSISFQKIEQKVNPQIRFREREAQIEALNNQRVDEIRQKMGYLTQDQSQIQAWSLKQLLEHAETIQLLDVEHPYADLIAYLLRNGYINEDYPYYISLFHEGRLTQADYRFLLSLKNRTGQPYDYPLDCIDYLLERIQPRECTTAAILNDALTRHLLLNEKSYPEHASRYFVQLSNEKESSLAYIDNYLTFVEADRPAFVQRLAQAWPQWCDFLQSHSERYSEQMRDAIFGWLLRYAELSDLVRQDAHHSLSKFILSRRDFLTWVIHAYAGTDGIDLLQTPINVKTILQRSDYVQRITRIIDKLCIRFTALDAPKAPSPILDYIYENGYYELTPEMIALFVQTQGKDVLAEELPHANYSAVLTSGCKPLIERIEQNLTTYIDRVFLALETNTHETAEAIVRLLNSEKVTDEQKQAIIAKEVTRLTDITAIEDRQLWSVLLRNNRVLPRWCNVVPYFQHVGQAMDDPLIALLNDPENFRALSQTKFDEGQSMEEADIETLALGLILNEELSMESYTALLRSIPASCAEWEGLEVEHLSAEKVDVLIQEGFMALSPHDFNRLKEHFPPKHIALLEQHAAEFDERITEFALDAEDVRMLIQSAELSFDQKRHLIGAVDEALIVGQQDTSRQVGELLYAHEDHTPLSVPLLEALLRHASSAEQQITLLLNHWDSIATYDEKTLLLQACGTPYDKVTKKGKYPKIPNTPYNKALAEKLEAEGYISSQSPKGEDIQINTRHR